MHTTLKRLQERDASEWRIEDRFSHYQNALTDIVEKASRQAVEYAKQFENPVLVMEDLTYIRERLDYGKYMNRRLHSGLRPTARTHRGQGEGSRHPGRVRESGVHVADVPLVPPYRSAGLAGRVSVSERRLPRFDVSGRHQRFREHRTTD